MERLHELTKQSENIGINVLKLHKNYKDAKRTQQAGNVFEFCGGRKCKLRLKTTLAKHSVIVDTRTSLKTVVDAQFTKLYEICMF